jgi:DNA polymerase (family 10)
VDNSGVARALSEIADLLEIKGENAFKIRAYRSAADVVRTTAEPMARLSDAQLRELPGIGKDLAARIRELAETGTCEPYKALLQEFPPTILELLRLQGVGPKTVAQLYGALGIASLDALTAAVRDGRLRGLKGMGAKKEALILKAIEERTRTAGRHLLADATALAAEVMALITTAHPSASLVPVGSLRRGAETCGDVDLLCTGASDEVMATFVGNPRVERVLGRGDTKSSVRMQGGFQVDLRLVPAESRGAAMQYFTGSKAHNIALRDRALQRGMTLNEYGLFRIDTGEVVAGPTEEGIYGPSAWPGSNRSSASSGASSTRPKTGACPGCSPRAIFSAISTCIRRRRMGATPSRRWPPRLIGAAIATSPSPTTRRPWPWPTASMNAGRLSTRPRVRAMNGRYENLTLLAGIECDILADGTLDLADDCLAQLDIVVASIHSNFTQEEAQATDRVLRAIDCPYVDVLGHPTGRRLFKREPIAMDVPRVLAAAVERGVALELNGQAERMDLGDVHVRLARELGARFVVSSDAHSIDSFNNVRWSVRMARRGWLTPADVLNTYPLDTLRANLRRHARQ